jgi:hypothetical protein
MILNRRKLIGGIGLVFAAPAIVRVSSLMPVKAYPLTITLDEYCERILRPYVEARAHEMAQAIAHDIFSQGTGPEYLQGFYT